ncbi:replication protein C [Acetobacter sicerae]|nr:replication protein C [Acetobacter sicerae]
MITETYQPPGGLRRITPAMLAAQVQAQAMPMSGVARPEILRVLRLARSAVGLTCQQVELLAYLSSWTDLEDWIDEDGEPLCTARNLDIQERFDLGRTRVKELLRGLAEAGWIIHRDSPNGQRYVRRSRGSRKALYGYGIDLSPLSRRYPELAHAAAAQEERRREGRRLHREVMALARRIYALSETCLEVGLPMTDAKRFALEANRLTQLRGEDRNPKILEPILARLTAMEQELEFAIQAANPVESDPMGSAERPHYTTTKPDHIAHATVGGTGYAGKAHEAGRSRSCEPRRATESALKGFRVTPTFLLQLVPALRDICQTDRPNEREILDAVALLCNSLGVSTHAWKQAISVLGPYEAAVAVCVIAARHAKGLVKSAGGLLRAMITRHSKGELALDRSLYGLADQIKASASVH